MAQAWDAYRAALRAGLRDHHADTLAFAVRAFAKGTRATYLCVVRGTLRGTEYDDDVQLAIDSRLLLLGHRRRGGSVARNTVSGFQMLAKLQLILEVVTTRMWLQVRAIDKSTAHLARPRIWATGKDLERLGRCRHHWAWARTFFAVACAAVFALRVGDVGGFTWDGIATPRFLTFWDQKVNAEWVTVPLSPYLEKWRAYIHRYKRPDHQPTTPLFPGDSFASKCLHDMLENTPSAHITWHPWKRFAAAAYIWLGGTTTGLQQWARWHSPKQARHYAKHPPTWSLPDTLCLPLPARFTDAAMAIDTEATAPQTPAEDPEALQEAPQQHDLTQSPPRTSPQRFPATPVTPASGAASPPERSPNAAPPDTTQPPHPAKRPHEPTGVTPAPQRKARPPNPPTPIRSPPTLQSDADSNAQPQHDHAPFGDTISSRLGRAHGTCSGSRDPCHCSQDKWTQPPHAPALEHLQHMMQRAARRMSLKGPRFSTILSLLRDLATLAMNRAWDRGLWTTTTEHITAVVAVLADHDAREEDISPPSDTSPKPKQTPGAPACGAERHRSCRSHTHRAGNVAQAQACRHGAGAALFCSGPVLKVCTLLQCSDQAQS